MLVKFVSSETGELMMFADMAGTLLRAAGKETGRRGTFTREEMLPAAQLLRAAVARGEAGDSKANDDDAGAEQPVTAAPEVQRAPQPVIDWLRRRAPWLRPAK